MEAGRTELPAALDLVAPLEGEVIAQFGAEGLSPGLVTQSFGAEAWARVEPGRILCSFHGTEANFYFPVVSDPRLLPLQRGVHYEAVLRYGVSRNDPQTPLRLSFGARTTEGGWRKDVGVRYFQAAEGATGEIRTQFVPKDYDDYFLYLSMNGSGDLWVESLTLKKAP